MKKALTYIAIGFLFTLVNFNLIFNGKSINIVPDFVGWILFYIAFDKLGKYVSDKKYLKLCSLVLAILNGVLWLASIIDVSVDFSIVSIISAILGAVYMFILFGALENVANDFAPEKKDTIKYLRYINIIVVIVLNIGVFMFSLEQNKATALIVTIFSFIGLIAAIFTCVALFQLANSINE